MKSKQIISLSLLSLASAMVLADATFHLSGCIKGIPSGEVLIYNIDDHKYDTLRIAKDGTFSQDIPVKGASNAYLILSDLRLSKSLFLEEGKNGEVEGTVAKSKTDGKTEYSLDITYTGDNKDVIDYLAKHDEFEVMNKWSFEHINTLDFATYREKLFEDIDKQKCEVSKLSNIAFKRSALNRIDQLTNASLARWAWKDHLYDDPNFRNWILSLDHNDPQNMEEASTYERWYRRLYKAKLGKNYYAELKEMFSNQEVVNKLADDMILQTLQQAPDDMEQQLADYLAVTTNEEGKKKAKEVYEQYKNLKKGGQAKDFTMQDARGKTFSLKDFHGKLLVVDVWATWCGPCCYQIPFYEKLAAQYKGNNKVEFISISLDSDKQKWLRKLAQDKPKWKQFICPDNFQSDLCKNYDINGIPRFMVFSGDGKVISLYAPAPSTPGLKKLIDENL